MDRIGKIIKGFFSMFLTGLENRNPKALLQAEIENFQKAIAQFNTNLARQAGLVERLAEQVRRQHRDIEQLKARATASYNAKMFDEAGRLALQMKQAQSDIAENQSQLQQAEELYQNLSRQRDAYTKEAQRRIESIKQKMSRVEMAESQAQLAELSSNVAFDMAGSGATLQRIEENLDERVAVATGKARVAADSAKSGEWAVKEGEQHALEQQALAEFATSMGMSTPPLMGVPAPVAAPPTRDLGPTEKSGA